MAATKINARDWVFQIGDGAATPTWTDIAGINSFTLNPGENEEDVDTTTFESAGVYESQKMQVGATLEVDGLYLLDADAGTRDAGQLAVETLAGKVGDASLGPVRFRHVSQESWVVWTAWPSLGEQGGGNNDKTSWSVTFNRSGAATSAAVTP